MTTYTIQILNNSGFSKSYFAFMEAPVVTSNGGQPVVYTNAWATFNSILSGGYDSISITPTTYAYWGTTPDTLGPGTRFSSGGSVQVSTVTNDSVTFTSGPPTGFSAVTSPGTAQTGAFEIVAGTDFTPLNGYVFGLAAASQTPIPTPVATFAASPNNIFNIVPVVKFYVAEGAYYPGEVIDPSQVANPATIDFTGRPQTTATAIQAADGTWTVVYS